MVGTENLSMYFGVDNAGQTLLPIARHNSDILPQHRGDDLKIHGRGEAEIERFLPFGGLHEIAVLRGGGGTGVELAVRPFKQVVDIEQGAGLHKTVGLVPQKIFVFVASSTCTSSPITVSYCFIVKTFLSYLRFFSFTLY